MAKSKKQVEEEAEKSRKAAVDKVNRDKAEEAKKKEEAEALVPLTAEELAFVNRIAPRMNKGRAIDQPPSADILRYSRLIKRKNV